ncbi:Uncharacterized conserved protein, contains Zn finger domain [Methylobacterium sp. 174MFSha1.1]|uniref:SWIM zinc finger family protein n=1 Tax=Methylobacterium sp. 174MFSha1.1 TaxID=1502749 RepID=UPI0008EF27B0|nr:SWIM zinc finger family protein [Methylobacterium sp. 174MFSha1.1]SFU84283.1 Uncharacterized conserved protein, contains Zn finger domain [Methylobacterium sp. 174MFSha1.1]
MTVRRVGKRVTKGEAPAALPGEAAIKALADPKIVERGREVARAGAVSDLVRRGDVLTAAVAGSEDAPYRVTIHLKDGRATDLRCTCPYEWGDVCKHAVATLIAAGKPGAVAERPTLRQILDDLPRESLATLLLRRAEADPDLAGWIEVELAVAPGRDAVDPAPIAAQARTLLAHRARSYWDDYDSAGPSDELQTLVGKAVPFLEAGDGRNALRVLVAVAEPFIEEWLGEMAETDEDMYLLFEDLGRMMAEAVLIGDLSEDERDDLFETVEGWQAELSDYAPDGFSRVTAALAAGWDAPALQAVLAGKAGASLPETEKDLVAVRLRALAATGRSEEYLNLARAAGDDAAYADMLVRLDRVDEAVAYATRHVAGPDQILTLARRLREAGHADQALTLARSGLRRADEASGSAGALARWLRDEAAALKRRDLALEGARATFAESRALEDYVAARKVAGKDWEPVRDDLLTILAKSDFAHDRIAILLEERLIGDAMRAAEFSREDYVDEDVLHRLAEAALERDPAWVARFAEERAQPFLNGGSSRLYEKGAAWLAHARTAYLKQGKRAEWSARIEALIAEHKRRHALRPRLEALR